MQLTSLPILLSLGGFLHLTTASSFVAPPYEAPPFYTDPFLGPKDPNEYDDHCRITGKACIPGSHGPHNVDCHGKGFKMPASEMRSGADSLKIGEPSKTWDLRARHMRTFTKNNGGGLVKLCVFNHDTKKDTKFNNLALGEALWSIENTCCWEENGEYCRGGKTTNAHGVDGLDIEIVAINSGYESRDLAEDRNRFVDEDAEINF
ncbi:MAG: hypothetical protein Q9221_007578 [Calogaya cf. arnoldii]